MYIYILDIQARPCLAWLDLAWTGQAWPGWSRLGQAWLGLARPGLAWPGQAWSGLAMPGLARPGSEWHGVNDDDDDDDDSPWSMAFMKANEKSPYGGVSCKGVVRSKQKGFRPKTLRESEWSQN